ncbi:MAG: hypothetical protein GY822_16745 [Deltaproteobacteria bacterium]|nr:hypothetical protein [Deltaproteobacteria bacterium]
MDHDLTIGLWGFDAQAQKQFMHECKTSSTRRAKKRNALKNEGVNAA